MKLVRLIRTAVFAIVLTAPVVLAACGGGGDKLSTEEYFERVQRIGDTRSEQDEALTARLSTLPDNDIKEFRDIFRDLAKIIRDSIEAVADLDAPDVAANEQDEFVRAGRALSDAFDALVEDLDDAKSIEEAIELFSDTSELDNRGAAFDKACVALEEVGTDAGIDVDLHCDS